MVLAWQELDTGISSSISVTAKHFRRSSGARRRDRPIRLRDGAASRRQRSPFWQACTRSLQARALRSRMRLGTKDSGLQPKGSRRLSARTGERTGSRTSGRERRCARQVRVPRAVRRGSRRAHRAELGLPGCAWKQSRTRRRADLPVRASGSGQMAARFHDFRTRRDRAEMKLVEVFHFCSRSTGDA